jgi:hypothetical protein
MVRRSLVLATSVLMSMAFVTIAGCESLREAIRSSHDDKAAMSEKPKSEAAGVFAVESEPTKIQAPDATAKNPKTFFQNNRSTGGWSSEAREIEGHLGVGP